MDRSVVVRYQTRPEAAEENSRLVRNVYAALADVAPSDFQYATYRLSDGVSFVHVASYARRTTPWRRCPSSPSSRRTSRSRVVEPPVASDATLVGSYGLQK